jgi:hypothetical protein
VGHAFEYATSATPPHPLEVDLTGHGSG